MSTFDWEAFLRQWSREALASNPTGHRDLTEDLIKSGWLGYAGATEAQIAHVEERLGICLPPSYRAFLQVTNGWRQTTPFIDKLWSVENIEWFATRHSAWLNQFKALPQKKPASVDRPQNRFEGATPDSTVSDRDYFVYGVNQDPSKIRMDYLEATLEISDRGEATIYLLNPKVISADGEWEAWFFGDWLPGADRYRSFQEMMQAEYQNFLELREAPDHD